MSAQGLVHGPLGKNCIHLCVDMQGLFELGAPWAVPWMERVVPVIEALTEAHPASTIFTRFIPVERAEEAPGSWSRYYRRWADVTLAKIDPALVAIVPTLARFIPPARVLDKHVYSPWTEGTLDRLLGGSETDAIVITGGETDVCVLATVLGAVDRGYRVVLVADAICSSADETHDALMRVYRSRFSEQIELATVEEILDGWRV